MKKMLYYGLTVLCFIIIMILFNGTAFLLGLGVMLAGAVMEGSGGMEAAADFLASHVNFYSALLYLIIGTVVFLWYYFAVIERQKTAVFFKEQTKRIRPISFLWIVFLGFAVQHLTGILMTAIGIIMPSAMEDYMDMISTAGFSEYSVMWAISTIILPPLVEETIFRGIIVHYLKKAGAGFLAANLIQAVLFGIFHMNIVQGIYAALIGFLLGYLAYRYESLLIPMIFHGIFNLFGTVLPELENRFMPPVMYGMTVLGSIPLFIFIILMIHFEIGEKRMIKGGRT